MVVNRKPGAIVYTCHSCGRPLTILFYGDDKGLGIELPEYYKKNKFNGIPSLETVVRKFGGRCPYCGASLGKAPTLISAMKLRRDGLEYLRRHLEEYYGGVVDGDKMYNNWERPKGSSYSLRYPEGGHSSESQESGRSEIRRLLGSPLHEIQDNDIRKQARRSAEECARVA